MLLCAKIAPFVVLATRVVAGLASVDDTLVSIPITKRITPAGTVNVVQKDYKRSRFLLNGSQQHEFGIQTSLSMTYKQLESTQLKLVSVTRLPFVSLVKFEPCRPPVVS
jgi:hypothetical protein